MILINVVFYCAVPKNKDMKDKSQALYSLLKIIVAVHLNIVLS